MYQYDRYEVVSHDDGYAVIDLRSPAVENRVVAVFYGKPAYANATAFAYMKNMWGS